MGQYGNPYGGQQQVLVPMSRNHPPTTADGAGGGGSGGYASNSTGSLGGPSRRSSSSSGNQPRTPAGYAPTGMHMAQPHLQGGPLVSALVLIARIKYLYRWFPLKPVLLIHFFLCRAEFVHEMVFSRIVRLILGMMSF